MKRLLLAVTLVASFVIVSESVASADAVWEQFPGGTLYCEYDYMWDTYYQHNDIQYWCYDDKAQVWFRALPGGYPSYPA